MPRRFGGRGLRLIIAVIIAVAAIASYYGKRELNPVTGETQSVDLSVDEEIALGLRAAPQMADEYGGLDPDPADQQRVDRIGRALVASTAAGSTDYQFKFHLLGDAETVNAFALPGGQIFITRALYVRLDSDALLAGVLGHEIGHVVGRHGAEHLAKQKLTQGLTGAAVVAAYDPDNPSSAQAAQMAMVVGQLVNMKYGRDDELESDRLGVRFMAESGYNPEAMIRVMEILAESGGGGAPPEFFSTHPNPDRRIERIREAIAAEFPGGSPADLEG